MATNIIELIQQRMGKPAVQKVDPNIQETKEKSAPASNEKLAQAAIPAVLAVLFKFTRTDEGCNYIVSGNNSRPWLDTLLEDKKTEAVEKVAHYAGVSGAEAGQAMENAAVEAVAIIKEQAGEQPTAEKIKSYMSDQRHHILTTLPAALQLGDLMNDDAMDDRTNKMEGPISNLMHKIENKFSGGGS